MKIIWESIEKILNEICIKYKEKIGPSRVFWKEDAERLELIPNYIVVISKYSHIPSWKTNHNVVLLISSAVLICDTSDYFPIPTICLKNAASEITFIVDIDKRYLTQADIKRLT